MSTTNPAKATSSRTSPPGAVTTPTIATRRETCRYLRRSGNQCTAEVIDPLGEILLCAKHLAQAMRLVTSRMPGRGVR